MTVAETMIAIITYIPIDNDRSLLYHNSNYIVLTDMLVSYYEVRYSFVAFLARYWHPFLRDPRRLLSIVAI